MTYQQWMKAVDSIIAGKTGGLTSSDLADGPSRSAFDSGTSPEDYASQLLESEGFPSEESE